MQAAIDWVKTKWVEIVGAVVLTLAYLLQREKQKNKDLTHQVESATLDKELAVSEDQATEDRKSYEALRDKYLAAESAHPELLDRKREE